MIVDFMDFIFDQLAQCQSKGNHVFSPPHGGEIVGLKMLKNKNTCVCSVL
jgi:hypothetical protein